MIGTFSTAGFTREAWIERRVAEGFTKEQAEHEFEPQSFYSFMRQEAVKS